MLKKLIPALLLLLIPLNIGFSEKDFTGKYTLNLSGATTKDYLGNFIEIDSISGKEITGIVGLDFSLGPEARLKMSWEKLHQLPFKGKYDSRKNKILLTVRLPWNKRMIKYTFSGYFIQTKTIKGIVGIYQIENKEQGGFLAQK